MSARREKMQIRYTVVPKDRDIRSSEIATRSKEAHEKRSVRREYKFRGGREELPVITLPLEYLIYRLENYRTRDKQLSLIASGQLPHGFFDPTRREDATVQQRQHEILVEQAQRGSGETIKPIYDELAKVAEQTDDLLISSDGVVVNGNRRLSAMRELIRENPLQFKKFSDVTCAVLPESATIEEILRVEIGLQMQPETKLPYEWTALGRAARDLLDGGMTPEDIAGLMNRDKTDISRAVRMMESADLYLRDWLSKPDDYDALDDTEQAFRQIATRNFTKTDDLPLREVTRKIDFFVVERRRDLNNRAYSLINTIEENPTLFLDTLAAEFELDLPPAQPAVGSQHKISFDDPALPAGKDYSLLIQRIAGTRGDNRAAEETVRAVENVCQVVAEQGRNLDKAAVKFAKSAEKNLLAIDLQTAGTGSYPELRAALEKCMEVAGRLHDELITRTGASGTRQ